MGNMVNNILAKMLLTKNNLMLNKLAYASIDLRIAIVSTVQVIQVIRIMLTRSSERIFKFKLKSDEKEKKTHILVKTAGL